VLTQIGLVTPFSSSSGVAAGSILAVKWLMFVCYPGSGLDIEKGAPKRGVKMAWSQEQLEGIRPSWHKNVNVAHAFDTWFLNLAPEQALFTGEDFKQARKPFVSNRGGYQTLSFIPSLVTMIFGLMCGELLRSNR
jgi:heparan-alpha-glucosaminide N-acetyltransferase